MTTTRRASLWVSCLLLLPAPAALAQSDPAASFGPPPSHISVIEGQAFVDREGRSDPAVANLPLLDGDRLRTTDGRLEVILPDGSLLHVDRDTTVDVMASDLLRLLEGRVYVVVRGSRDPQRAVRYQVDAPAASVQTGGPGEFRVWAAENTRGREVELAVFRGQATIASNSGAQDLRAGERSIARDGLAPSAPQYFNSARWDDFDRWSAARRDEALGADSAQYLPSDLEVYAGTFDRYGTWRNDPDDGAVWYPSVGADWRPYSIGYWHTYPEWGSFWIGGDPWGWPTHHYGYWGFSSSFGWYWRPAPVWGPAWVSWAYSPGYVSWCPLGRYGEPVFGQFGMHGGYHGERVDPWRGWTVVPRQQFGRPMPVHHVAVDGNRLGPADRGAFAVRREGPGVQRAVPRPLAGNGAVPRAPAGGGSAVPRANVGRTAVGGGEAAALPRAGGSRALPDRPARLSPGDAARVLAGGGTRSSATAMRRPLPSAPALDSVGQQTETPPATPDVTAFGNRREPLSAVPRENSRAGARAAYGNRAPAQFGNGQPAQFGNGEPAQFGNGEPAQFGNGEPAQFGNGAPAAFGSGGRPRSYPRANPASQPAGAGAWSSPPAARQNPYSRGDGFGGGAGAVERRDYPRAAPPPAPRDIPYMRGGAEGSAPERSARPRESGGIPSGPAVRSGGVSGSSAPPSAPRYNPGSGASQPRSGGAPSPPPRGRGGREP